MDKTIEIKAIDKEKALKRALNILDVKLEGNEKIEIIEKKAPKKKFFGLLGIEPGIYEIKLVKNGIKEIKDEVKKTLKKEEKQINKIEETKAEKNIKIEKVQVKQHSKKIENKEEITKEKTKVNTNLNIEKEILEKTNFLLEKMNLDLQVEVVKIKEKSYLINLVGADNAVIIGQKGKTLNSFEYLLNCLLNDCRVEVDVEKFKEKRNATLRSLAKKMAEKVLKTNKTIRLNAMPPRERKIIHEVVNKYQGLDTYSEGRDPKRYIVIKKKK